MTKHAMSGRRTKIQKIAKDGAMKANPIKRLLSLGFVKNVEPDKETSPLSGSAFLITD
jgi:hypothetical protein